MSTTVKKLGIALVVLGIGGVVVMTVNGDELPPQLSSLPPQPPIPPSPDINESLQTQPPEPPAPNEISQILPEESKIKEQNPPMPLQPESNTLTPPRPPKPPSEQEISQNELWHAYREFQEVKRLIISSQTKNTEIDELENLAERFYEKSRSLYEKGQYTESKVYAHLTIEVLHGIREILTKEG
jgi:hypothetical protein